MSKIQRQGTINSLINYLGTLIGFFTTVVLFPVYFSEEEIGFRSIITEISRIFGVLSLFGMAAVYIKFYPYYNQRKEDGKLRFFTITVFAFVFVIITLLILIFHDTFITWYNEDSLLLAANYYVLLPMIFSMGVISLFTSFYNSMHLYTIPNIANTIYLRILLCVLVLVIGYSGFARDSFWLFYSLVYLFIPAYLFLDLWRRDKSFFKPSLEVFKRKERKGIYKYGVYNLLNGITSSLSLKIDLIMIGAMMTIADAGAYGFTVYLISLVEIPRRVINQISVVYISEYWHNNELDKLRKLYKTVALNMMLLTMCVVSLLFLNLDEFYTVVAKGEFFSLARTALIIIGIGKVIDVSFSQNSEIVMLSSNYKYILYFTIVLMLLGILLNYLFIPDYGMTGAAIGTVLSFMIFNILKFVFLLKKLKTVPFSFRMIPAIVICAFSFWLSNSLVSSETLNVYLVMAIKTSTFIIVYTSLVYFFKVSNDYNELVNRWLSKLKR